MASCGLLHQVHVATKELRWTDPFRPVLPLFLVICLLIHPTDTDTDPRTHAFASRGSDPALFSRAPCPLSHAISMESFRSYTVVVTQAF